jgi:signal transduction histidine kinase
LTELRGTAEESIEELRRCVRMMRGDFDLRKAMEDFCSSFLKRGRVEVEFSMPGRIPPVRPDRQLMMLRVLQEAMNNAVKHAEPGRISVSVFEEGDDLVMKVADDGKGFTWTGGIEGHYGLANMRERARKAGAELDVESAPGRGTAVTLRMPGAGAVDV